MKLKAIIVITLIFSFGCSTYEATYQEKALEIDGSSSDWTTTLDSKNSSLFYGISNDEENLFIRLTINDQDIQRKILMAGLTIWVDTLGKKNKAVGITCPMKKPMPRMNSRIQNQPTMKNDQLLEAEFIGFKEFAEIYFITNNPYEIEVSIDQDAFKSFYYEMKIPLKSIYSNYSNLSLKTLSIGFETGSIDMPTPGNKPSGMNSQPTGMSRNGGGGGREGQGGGKQSGSRPQNASMSNLNSPTKFWIKNINLAQQ